MKTLANIIFILNLVHLVFGDGEVTTEPVTEPVKEPAIEPDPYKLEQLQVLFRHGDRTPSIPEIFPNDPNEEAFKKIGYGQLTKAGKERVYKVGQLLRKRYDAFLGEYKDDEVFAYSSDMDRTKKSLQLVLAGLYPPSPSDAWSDTILWNPIPTHSKAVDLCFLSTLNCPVREREVFKNHEEPELRALFEKNEALYRRIENHTGITLSTLMTGGLVYNNICQTMSLGLPFPSWCSDEDLKNLKEITVAFIRSFTHTELSRRMMAGPLTEQFLTVLTDDSNKKKIYLYGGHDVNVASYIDAHNITGVPELHDFASTIIMERLRGPDGKNYMRLFLWTGVSEQLIPMKIPNCDITCPVSEYEKYVQPILPTKESRICIPRKNTCTGVEEDLDMDFAYFYAGPDLNSFKYMHNFTSNTLD